MSAKRLSKRWNDRDTSELLNMVFSGCVLNKDIAKYFEVMPNTISAKLRQLGVKNDAVKSVIGKWNIKHAHLREQLLRYYLNHTAEECQKKFKLTQREFKSCLTNAYKAPEFRHLRKETRRHDAWSAKEFRFLLQHSGLVPRAYIAKKLKRGGVEATRGKLDQLGISSKNINGLTMSQYRMAFSSEPEFFIQTKAGPTRGLSGASQFKIIPWVWIAAEIQTKRLRTHKTFRDLVYSMAIFQEWIFEGDVLKKMKRIVKNAEKTS